MRKASREITDFNKIIDIIKNTNTIRLAIHDTKYPYIVPVSFGFEVADNKIIFYFHGATCGKKIDLINTNPFVSVEGDIFHRYMDTIKSVTCLYESFIANGICTKLTKEEEKTHGLQLILDHCGYSNHYFSKDTLPIVAVYKIEVDSITAKHRTENN